MPVSFSIKNVPDDSQKSCVPGRLSITVDAGGTAGDLRGRCDSGKAINPFGIT